jgi:hypothetical protein
LSGCYAENPLIQQQYQKTLTQVKEHLKAELGGGFALKTATLLLRRRAMQICEKLGIDGGLPKAEVMLAEVKHSLDFNSAALASELRECDEKARDLHVQSHGHISDTAWWALVIYSFVRDSLQFDASVVRRFAASLGSNDIKIAQFENQAYIDWLLPQSDAFSGKNKLYNCYVDNGNSTQKTSVRYHQSFLSPITVYYILKHRLVAKSHTNDFPKNVFKGLSQVMWSGLEPPKEINSIHRLLTAISHDSMMNGGQSLSPVLAEVA